MPPPSAELREALTGCAGLVVRSETKVTSDVMDNATALRVIGRAGVGVDNIDVPGATERGIVVMNAPDGNTITTAEHTIALLIALARRIPQANSSLKSGKWERKAFIGVELQGKTLGVVGLGRIGRTVAARARAFGMKIVAFDPFLAPEQARDAEIELAPLDELFASADFITVHTPLTAETRGVIGREAFARMKQGVRIINCARGGLVDESALYDAIKLGTVAGAALDVFVDEPPAACGFASEIAAQVVEAGFDDLDAPVRRLTGVFTPTPYSPSIENAVVPTADGIAAAIRSLSQE